MSNALRLGIQTYQILTNDVLQVFILSCKARLPQPNHPQLKTSNYLKCDINLIILQFIMYKTFKIISILRCEHFCVTSSWCDCVAYLKSLHSIYVLGQ